MTNVRLDMLPHCFAVMADSYTEMHVLVRAQAHSRPEGRSTERLPLNLAMVLDRSGSMSGVPLEEAKRSASYVLDQLDS